MAHLTTPLLFAKAAALALLAAAPGLVAAAALNEESCAAPAPVAEQATTPENPFTAASAFAEPALYTIILADGLSESTALELAGRAASPLRIERVGDTYRLCMGSWTSAREATEANESVAAAVGLPDGRLNQLNLGAVVEPPAMTPWSISAGQFPARDQADAAAERLRAEGYVQLAVSQIGEVFHVTIGPGYATERDASTERELLASLGLTGTQVIAPTGAALPAATIRSSALRTDLNQAVALK